jgi:transcriptional regulator with AAA-type ATPase domain
MAAAATQVFQVPTESAGMFESFDEEDLDLCDEVVADSMFEEIVGSSGAISRVRDQILKVAPSDATVLSPERVAPGRN